MQINHPVRTRRHDHDSEAEALEILLILEVLVRRQEHLETFLDSAAQQLAVAQPRPPLLGEVRTSCSVNSRASWRGRDSSSRTRTLHQAFAGNLESRYGLLMLYRRERLEEFF